MRTLGVDHIGGHVYRLRTALKLSQQKLAESLGISQPHLSKIENGEAFPSVETLLQAALIFGRPMESFLLDVSRGVSPKRGELKNEDRKQPLN